MLSALSLVKIRWGSERLGAFAKPNILNVECMKKTEQCSSSWSSWCRTWSRLIAAQCTSTATTTIYLLFRTVMNALNVLSETDWFQSVSATSVLCTSVNVVLKSAKLGLRWLGSHNSGVKQGVQLKRWRWSRKVNVTGDWVGGGAMRVAKSEVKLRWRS